MEAPILQIAVIVGAGIGAQWLAQVLRLPSIVFMLAAGVVVGPVLGWVDPDALLGDLLGPLVSIAVAVILFEGGLNLRLSEIASEKGIVARLVSVGVIVTWAIASITAYNVLDLSVAVAVLLGAILIVSGPTVVGPLLRQIRPHGASGRILQWESILIDPIGAMVAVVVLEVIVAGETGAGGAVGHALVFIGIGLGLGVVAALMVVPLLRWHIVPDRLHDSLTLAIAIVAFVVSNGIAKESGLLTVTIMGIVLANQRWAEISHVQVFKENLVVLTLPVVFVVLAARLDPSSIAEVAIPATIIVVLLVVVARPLAVLASTFSTNLTWPERGFIAWMAPRGVVAALVASVFAADLVAEDVEGARVLVPVTFFVIAATALVYGMSAPWVARRLGVAESDPQGFLILGAGPVERRIATALAEADVDVMLAATSRAHEYDARMAGLPTYFGDLLGEDTISSLDLRGIGRVLALNQNHEFNSLAALHFREDFGRGNVYQLHPGTDGEGTDTEAMAGRPLFADDATYEGLAERLISGQEVKVTALTHTYDWQQLRADRPVILPLFVIRGQSVNVMTGRAFTPRPGDRVVYIAPPPETAPATA